MTYSDTAYPAWNGLSRICNEVLTALKWERLLSGTSGEMDFMSGIHLLFNTHAQHLQHAHTHTSNQAGNSNVCKGFVVFNRYLIIHFPPLTQWFLCFSLNSSRFSRIKLVQLVGIHCYYCPYSEWSGSSLITEDKQRLTWGPRGWHSHQKRFSTKSESHHIGQPWT